MKVCVFAPYGRNEVTAAAIRVADLSLALGNETFLLASAVRESHRHQRWDARVCSSRTERVHHVARNADVCVWFDASTRLYRAASLVAPRAMHILVWRWQLDSPPLDLLRGFHCIVFPCQAAQQVFASTYRLQGGEAPLMRVIPFDAGLPRVRRRGLVQDEPAVIVLADASVVGPWGEELLSLLQLLHRDLPNLSLTVLSSSSWPRSLRRYLRHLQLGNPSLRFERAGSWTDQLVALHRHDLTFVASLRLDFAINVMRSLACGAPVVAHDIPPVSELLDPDCHGWRIPCSVRHNDLGVPEALPSLTVSLDTLRYAVNALCIDYRRVSDQSLAERAAAFEKAWRLLLR